MDDPVSDHVYDMNNLASCEKFMDGDEGFPMMPSIRLAEKSSGDCAKLFSGQFSSCKTFDWPHCKNVDYLDENKRS